MTLRWTGDRTFSLEPKNPAFFENPYPYYRQMHERTGPVFWEQYGLWCLTDFVAVDRCLRDRRFARLPPAGHEKSPYPPHLQAFAQTERYSLLALEPPEHTRLRKLVNRAFVSRRVEAMADEIAELTHRCIDQFEADGEAELLSQFATPVPVTVIARLLGIPEEATDNLLNWSHAMVKVYTMVQSPEDETRANEASEAFIDFLQVQISAHRRAPSESLLSHLIAQQSDADGPSDDEIISIAILLLNAGHEATVHQLGNGVVALLKDPPVNSQWFNCRQSADAVVEECLRHDAPLHLFTRYAQESVTLDDDVVIEKGEQVALLLGAANRCPARFDEPDVFHADRSNNQSVALGAGIHFCVGAPLARLELRIALSTLFKRLPGLSLVGAPAYRDSYHFHGFDELRVKW